jgi:hypothetical protein
MKKINILITAIFMIATLSQAQVLVKWTFPTGNPTDSIADGGTALNLDKAIHTEGGTSAIDFSKNGATTKSAQATGWDNGVSTKCWVIKVNTQGYETIKLSSKMQSGGNNPGPRDYKGQYRVGDAGSWVDIPGTTIVVANDWSTGVLDSVVLPVACNDQAVLYIRWIMTSNTNSTGGTVSSNGINKIDDIYVSGQPVIPGVKNQRPAIGLKVSPNPSNGLLVVEASEPIASLSVFNSGGKCVYKQSSLSSRKLNLNLDSIPSGTYFLKVKTTTGREGSQKVVLF